MTIVLKVSKLGFGCMCLTGNYNDPLPDEVGISIIKPAFDTSDIYGANNANELLVGNSGGPGLSNFWPF